TFDNLDITAAGAKGVTATSAGLSDAVSDPFTISAGAAAQLAFVQQPTDAASGVTIAPAVTVQLQDTYGNNVSSAGVDIVMAKSSGTGTLSGTATIATDANGLATFNDLSIELIGTKELTASSAGLTDAVSDPFTITAGAATQLIYISQPNDVVAGANFGPVTLQLADQYGNPVTTAGTSVTLALTSGTGSITGATTVNTDANGQVTFDNLDITAAGAKGVTATSAGLSDAVSDPFTISAGAAAQLAFVQQPTDAASGVTIAPAVTVQLQDTYGNNVSSAGVDIVLAKSSGTGTLSGTATIATDANGLATFNDLSIELIGTKELTATSAGLTDAVSDSFEIIPGAAVGLVFVDQPVLETAGELFLDQPIVRTIDAAGNFTSDVGNLSPANEFVTFSLIGGPGALSGTISLDIVNGVPGTITGFDMSANMAGTNWQLVATNSVLGSITSQVFTVVSPYMAPGPFGTNGVPHALLSGAGPIGLWLANLRGDQYPWFKPSIGLLWRDLVVANYNSNIVTVRLCKDDGTFEDAVTYEAGLNPFAVRSGFYSDYTYEDVAVANFGTNTLSIFRSVKDGSGQLMPRFDYVIGSTPNPGPIAISSAFASGSRYADVFVANSNECTVSVLRNVSGIFVLETNIPVGLNPMSIHARDVDGDSIVDIVTANQGDGTLTILRGQPDFTFVHWKTITLFPGGTPAPTYALAGDVNKDGLMDIVVANGGSNTVSILLQNSSQEFVIATNYSVGLNPRCLLLRDLNKDKNLDIAVANFGGATVDILMGNGDGTFERGGRIATGRNPICVVGSNFNGDGTTDIAVSNFGDDTISLFLYSGPIATDVLATTSRNQPVNIVLKGSLLNSSDLGYLVLDDPANGTLSGTPPNLVYTPAVDFVGTDTFRYQAFHTGYTGPESLQFPPNTGFFNTNYASTPATVTVTVKPVNQAPSFTLTTTRIEVPSSAALQTVPNAASGISAGANEPEQTVKFVITGAPKSFFSVTPSMTEDGTLTFKPAHMAVGTNVVQIRLQDDGSTANGGANSSPTQELEIVVLPNVAPSFQLATNLVVGQQFSGTQIIPDFATDITAGQDEAGQTVTFLITLTNAAFFAEKPVIAANGALTFAPSWAASGTNYIRISLRDNGSTTLGGTNQSADQVVAISLPSVPNPFLELKSLTYNGLFSDTNNGIAHHSAGFVTIKVSSKMSYSGKLLLDGNALGFSGKFNSDGTASVTTKARVKKFDKPELTLNLLLDIATSSDLIEGTIAEGSTWTAQMSADRRVWTLNPGEEATAFTNRYTMLLDGFSNKADGPIGTGYGVLSVDKLGRIRASGAMGDSMLLKQSTILSKEGYWPFFSPGYKVARLNASGKTIIETKGFALGWLNFETNALGNMAPEGNLHWIKTGWTNAAYTVGFTNDNVAVQGSRWLAPVRFASSAAVDMTDAVVDFAYGDLGVNLFSANFLMRTNTTLVVSNGVVNPNLTKIGLSPKTGFFKGTFLHPVDPVTTRYFGVLLQDYNLGRGHFMGPTESGTVELNSAD
nr:VCBS repeat-containing protein [Verrucomicrobiota bacterium]